LHFPSSIVSYIEDKNSGLTAQAILNHAWISARNARGNASESSSNTTMKIYVPTNPRGAEMLAPGIIASESDFNAHRLWGDPAEVAILFCISTFQLMGCLSFFLFHLICCIPPQRE
uniref:Uncharacterized protein n=1 Tax=Aegilops tauschii subsp. strangulata TaxID=200361 RepID=A0A453GW33_AEGTS